MPSVSRVACLRAAACIGTALGLLASGCGGGGGGANGDWYYHWNCHGDSQCLATNPTGAASGTLDEGPVLVNCTQLREFSKRFWGPAATDSCDQSPGGSGPPDAGSDGGTGVTGAPTITYVTPGGAPGTVISVTGTNFPSSAAGVTVTIGGATATVVSASAGNINISVPNLNAGNYPLIVTTAGGSATWTSPFQVLAKHSPGALVVDASSVYWLEDDGSVKKVSLAGGTVTALATGLGSPRGLAQDSSSIYFTDLQKGNVQRVAKSGGAVATLASGLSSPFAIAVDSTSVYFIENGNTTMSKVPIGGGAVTRLLTGSIYGDVLAVDASGLYYFVPAQVLYKVGLAGGAAVQIENISDSLGGSLAIDSTSVYWGFSALRRAPVGGGSATTYTAPIGRVGAVAVDASSLYYVNISLDGAVSTTQIASVPLQDGAVKVLVQASGANDALAVDGTSVYWTERSTSSVKKVPKGGGAVVTLATSPNVP